MNSFQMTTSYYTTTDTLATRWELKEQSTLPTKPNSLLL